MNKIIKELAIRQAAEARNSLEHCMSKTDDLHTFSPAYELHQLAIATIRLCSAVQILLDGIEDQEPG